MVAKSSQGPAFSLSWEMAVLDNLCESEERRYTKIGFKNISNRMAAVLGRFIHSPPCISVLGMCQLFQPGNSSMEKSGFP